MMKRHLSGLLLLLLVALLAVPALAAETKFSNFSVQLPEGWSSKQDGDKAELTSPDGSCLVLIAFIPANGKSEKAFADALAKEMNGTKVEQIEDATNYGFDLNFKGKEGYATTGVEKDMGFYFIELGDYDTWQNDIGDIWNSMKSVNPRVKAVLTTLIPE